MAKTCQDVINRFARKLNVIPLGATLSSDESLNALSVLQSIYMELVGMGAFGRENDCMSCGDWVALPSQRIRMNNTAGEVSIPDSLPSYVQCPDWWQPIWGYDAWCTWPIWPTSQLCVPPRDLSIVTVTDPFVGECHTFLYDAFVGKWTMIDALELTDEAPLSRRWFEPLCNTLSERMAPDYGQDPPKNPIWAHLQAVTMRYSDSSRPVQVDYM